ncbi:mesenchyme-specific cell surface glycoprotein [Plakobranchus ocellatus]|uniref:Mesenchyme-specific cell surface glycoprotein n=1 Tax=Plakobranchus ocellatus TaxID=259542 RepID=A0AAV4ASM8_9GAST|nr:mesenchyme-specific cell surface glycoprotein [Plakobranchus ocellatus]
MYVLRACITVLLVTATVSYVILKPKAYVRLNDVNGGKTINASTLNTVDFDYTTNILYVVAHEPSRMTAFTLAVDGTPTQLLEHVFNPALDGNPLDVEICRPMALGATARIAISFLNPASRSADGRVIFYQPLLFGSTELREIQRVTVGAYPFDLEFTEDCSILIVANKGKPTREGSQFRDPEGTLTKIQLGQDFTDATPIISSTISFNDYFVGETGLLNYMELLGNNFRTFPVRDPSNNLLTIEQNIEPHDLLVTENGRTAYVTMPVNNAIARINLFTDQVSEIYGLGNRTWTDYYLDASDRDGGISMQGYNIRSLYQATRLEWVNKNGREWIISLDTGYPNTNYEYRFTDYERGRVLQQAGAFNTGDNELESQLANDALLGRLSISTVDGVRPDGLIERAFTFGGRGFSIHSPTTLGIRSATVDSVEKVTKQYVPDVFNTAYTGPNSNPQADREATSPTLGPNLQAMDVAEFEDKTVLFVAGSSAGVLYVYVLSADSFCPQPYFHSLYRAGGKYSSWQSLYDTEQMGDIGITDVRYLRDIDLVPVLIVASATSNSVSIYTVEEGPFDVETGKEEIKEEEGDEDKEETRRRKRGRRGKEEEGKEEDEEEEEEEEEKKEDNS